MRADGEELPAMAGIIEKDPYAEYIAAARAIGCDEDELQAQVAIMRAESAALDRGECPKCGKPVKVTVDPRQAGPTKHPGTWVNYCCPCGLLVDRKEAVAGHAS
jgi:hypothetical protein